MWPTCHPQHPKGTWRMAFDKSSQTQREHGIQEQGEKDLLAAYLLPFLAVSEPAGRQTLLKKCASTGRSLQLPFHDLVIVPLDSKPLLPSQKSPTPALTEILTW